LNRDAGDAGRAREILDESQAAAFRLVDAGIQWREALISWNELRRAREELALSFGSCSFEEPIRDLQHMGWLPGDPATIAESAVLPAPSSRRVNRTR
jgi:hypothetical protein